MKTKKTIPENRDSIVRSLMKVDSSIRNGQFLYAYREAHKLVAELARGEYDIGEKNITEMVASIKRTILFLHPMVKAYSQNQSSLNIVRKI